MPARLPAGITNNENYLEFVMLSSRFPRSELKMVSAEVTLYYLGNSVLLNVGNP